MPERCRPCPCTQKHVRFSNVPTPTLSHDVFWGFILHLENLQATLYMGIRWTTAMFAETLRWWNKRIANWIDPGLPHGVNFGWRGGREGRITITRQRCFQCLRKCYRTYGSQVTHCATLLQKQCPKMLKQVRTGTLEQEIINLLQQYRHFSNESDAKSQWPVDSKHNTTKKCHTCPKSVKWKVYPPSLSFRKRTFWGYKKSAHTRVWKRREMYDETVWECIQNKQRITRLVRSAGIGANSNHFEGVTIIGYLWDTSKMRRILCHFPTMQRSGDLYFHLL